MSIRWLRETNLVFLFRLSGILHRVYRILTLKYGLGVLERYAFSAWYLLKNFWDILAVFFLRRTGALYTRTRGVRVVP